MALHIKHNILASRKSTYENLIYLLKPLDGRLSMGAQIDLVIGPPRKVTLPIPIRLNVKFLMYFKMLGNMMGNTFECLLT